MRRFSLWVLASALAGCFPPPPPLATVPASPRGEEAPTPTPAPVRRATGEPAPPVVRVRLSAAEPVVFPEPGRPFQVAVGGRVVMVRGPLRVESEGEVIGWQVGAFARESNARASLTRVQGAGLVGEVRREGEGLFRVVVRDQKGAKEKLRAAGFSQLQPQRWAPAVVRLIPAEGLPVEGEELRVVPLDLFPVQVGTRRYRGEFALRPGPQVINVVNLEDYLKGVVPAEMGFPQMEALKAQAVAARTYAWRQMAKNPQALLCDTEQCQVYAGVDVEKPQTTEAVMATAGLVLTFGGRPAEALFHSTCGGHTEDGEAVFPGITAPYLRGVACAGEQVRLGEGQAPSPWVDSMQALAWIGLWLAEKAGVRAEPEALLQAVEERVSGGTGEAGVAPQWGLLFRRMPPEELGAPLHRFGFPLSPRAVGREWGLAYGVRLAELYGVLQRREGRVAPGEEGGLFLRGEERRAVAGLPVVVQRGQWFRRGEVTTAAGSKAWLWSFEGQALALEVEWREEADGNSPWSTWVRERLWQEVEQRLGVSQLNQVRVTRRGVSGRALEVQLLTPSGARSLTGQEFRRRLELPSALFVLAVRRQGEESFLRVFGRGWGHGVGLCQNGAYGLALGGWDFAKILAHYYPGTKLEPLTSP